jgi:hypothetical protein
MMKHEGLIIGLLVAAIAFSAAGLILGIVHPARQPRVVAATGITHTLGDTFCLSRCL